MLPDQALAFVQRCQVVAGSWAGCSTDSDLVPPLTVVCDCLASTPVSRTHIERVAISSALLRTAWHVRIQLTMFEFRSARSARLPSRSRVNQALRCLAARRSEHDISLRALSAELLVTESYLSRAIHRELSRPFETLLHCLRLLDVVVLLRATTLPIKSIAWKSGYSSTAVMDRIFHRRLHMPPSAFRSAVHLSDTNPESVTRVRAAIDHWGLRSVAAIADDAGVDFGVAAHLGWPGYVEISEGSRPLQRPAYR
jgi:AraC-like DNA-binding protein